MQLYWEMGTYSHSGIELYIHTQLTNQSFIYCQYDQAIRPNVDLFILLKPKIFFRGKVGRLA